MEFKEFIKEHIKIIDDKFGSKIKKIAPIISPSIFIISFIIVYFINNIFLALLFLAIFIAFSRLKYIKKTKHEDKLIEIIEEINRQIKSNIMNLIYPIALIKENGEIFWCNKEFEKFTNGESAIGNNVVSIARGLNLSRLLSCDRELHQKIKILDATYKIYASKIEKNKLEDNVYVVYFNDISNIKNSDTTKEGIMLIEVDNIAEVLETTDEVNRPMLIADIEKSINVYAQRLKAMITKYDNNKFVLSIQDRYIDEEIINKFKILEEISDIDRGNRFEVTLSIGVGRGGTCPLENHNFAVKAKELALGRGGDQAVIKNNDQIKFFGGNTREIEKRTRVRARVVSHSLKELIYESSNVLIIGHKNPDMDCFGASIGMASVVKQLGKPCNIVLGKDTAAIDYYLNKIKNIKDYDNTIISVEEAHNNINEKTLIMIVDVHNISYILDANLVSKVNRKVIVDHHRRNADMVEGALLNYIEVYASSTSEMVTELIQYMVQKPNLKPIEAEGLLSGIFMDTKGFSYKSGVRTFDAASFLRGIGADTVEVKKMFTDDINDYLIISDTVRDAEIEDGIAISNLPSRCKKSFMAARAADELLNISGITVSFVLAQINSDIIISGRSNGDINVQVILESIGGGGHMNMAGAQLSNVSLEQAKEILKNSIKKHLKVGG